jgi:hypothetical protein
LAQSFRLSSEHVAPAGRWLFEHLAMAEQKGVEPFKVARQLGHDPDEIVACTPEVATDLDDVDGLARITEPV